MLIIIIIIIIIIIVIINNILKDAMLKSWSPVNGIKSQKRLWWYWNLGRGGRVFLHPSTCMHQ